MAITVAQSWVVLTTADEKTVSATLASSVSVGQLIVACFSWQGDGTGSITSPFTDSLGNSYTQDKAQANTSQDKVFQIWHSIVTNAGTPTITVSLAGGVARSSFTGYAGVYSGASGSTDASPPGANGSSGVPDYGSLTPTTDNSLIVAGAQGIGSSATADTGFTLQENNPSNGNSPNCNGCVATEIQTTATARNTFLTAPTSVGWASCAVVFQASAASGPPVEDYWIGGGPAIVDPRLMFFG